MTQTSSDDSADSQQMNPEVRLIVLWGDVQGQSLDLLPPATLIGSGSSCDIQVPSQQIAERHCLLTMQNEEVIIWDLHSEVGTCVNGQRVQFAPLRHNDQLLIGPARFRVEVLTPQPVGGMPVDLSEDSDFLPTGNPASTCDEDPVKPLGADTELHCQPMRSEQDENSALAQGLMNRGRITRYQAEWLKTGKFHPFRIADCDAVEILGTGGMAWIYLAQSAETGKKYAVKVLPRNQNCDLVARLKLEARAGMQLRHPNIVRTFDFRETEDVYYLLMEFVPGISLQELIELRGPLPWRQACDIGCQISQGLEYLHAQGMVHRDIKPGNVLIDRHGQARLLDFGLAMIDSSHDEEEFSLAMIFGQDCLGTPDYMAPEQTENSFAVDPRADIYGLGCTLFFALTGYVPFPLATAPEKLQAHRSQPIPLLSDHIDHVPDAIARAIEVMMAKLPAHRFHNASELRNCLQPHGVRDSVLFDFDRLLRKRAAEARYRLGLLCNQQSVLQQATAAHTHDSRFNLLKISHADHVDSQSPNLERTSVIIQPPSLRE